MNYFLVVFTSRSETLDFANKLNKNLVLANVISVPTGLESSCNIAISVARADYSKVVRVLAAQKYFTFKGFFAPQKMFGGKVKFVKIQ